MLIRALCDYYDVLAEQGKVLPEGYSNVGIHYLIALNPDGSLESIIDDQDTVRTERKGKIKETKFPKNMVLPKRTEKSSIDGNIIEHRPLYIFGLNYDAETASLTSEDRTDKAKKSHAAFVEKNLDFVDGIHVPVVVAYQNFLLRWNPAEETQNEELLKLGKAISTSRFAFCLAGRPDILLHEVPELKNKWEIFCKNSASEAVVKAQCSITGEYLPIARIHDKIRNVPSGSTMGNTLISYKNPSESSYGKEQSYNSGISESAMKKYTQALNDLIADKRHRTQIGDTTYIHWAASGNDSCDDMFNALVFGDSMGAEATDIWVSSVLETARAGTAATDNGTNMIDSDVYFYVVGLKPNSARLAVKCVYRQSFGKMIENILQHISDMKISEDSKPVPLWKIGKELVSPKSSNETVSPAIMSKILDAVINGTAYPETLLSTVVRRVKTDSDTEENNYIKMNDIRMGLIKACINRNARMNGRKVEMKMALDTENVNPAYLCGRLFFVLENIQQQASGYNLNRTIKDAYFASASTRPAVVFPKLLSLAQHHMAKLDNSRYQDQEISDLLSKLGNEFPKMLSLTDQGIFMLGYYHQKNDTIKRMKAAKAAAKN